MEPPASLDVYVKAFNNNFRQSGILREIDCRLFTTATARATVNVYGACMGMYWPCYSRVE